MVLLQILGAFIALGDPLLKLLRVACTKSDLEWLWLGCQGCRNRITLNCIKDWSVGCIFRRVHVESSDEADKSSKQFAISEM